MVLGTDVVGGGEEGVGAAVTGTDVAGALRLGAAVAGAAEAGAVLAGAVRTGAAVAGAVAAEESAVVVMAMPAGLSTHQVPKASFTPCPLA